MKRLLSSAALLALSAHGAGALGFPTSSAGQGQYGVSISSVAGLNAPTNAAAAEICVEGAAARYTSDGLTTPTSTVGIPVPAGTCFQYAAQMTSFRIIGAGATMDLEFFK